MKCCCEYCLPGHKISMRESLSGRHIEIRYSRMTGKWKAILFPNYDEIVETEVADDPVEAVVRMARKLQALPK